ncbi:methyltransferase domain-containing protein [bacterium]|nr:methyltransferase domain-containing protein [bacterium]
MKYQISEKFIQMISEHLIKNYLPERMRRGDRKELNDRDLKFFADSVDELSYSFTAGRSALPRNYLNMKEFRSAYILYFIIPNLLKIQFCLKEANVIENKISVLDLGCGPGTTSLACGDFFPKETEINIIGVDQNKAILKDARELTNNYSNINAKYFYENISHKNLHQITRNTNPFDAPRAKARGLLRVDPEPFGRKLDPTLSRRIKFDIIFLTNFINEYGDMERQLQLVLELSRNYLSKTGKLIIIDPALRHTSRNIMRLHDELLNASKEIDILAPCMGNYTCPMLEDNKRDWCHMYLDWERPPLIEKLDKLVGLKKDYLKFSYLILTTNDPPSLKLRRASDQWRVVSAPLRSKGKIELLICNKAGLKRLMRQDKDRSKKNAVLDNLNRGDLIEYNGPLKMGKGDPIKKI